MRAFLFPLLASTSTSFTIVHRKRPETCVFVDPLGGESLSPLGSFGRQPASSIEKVDRPQWGEAVRVQGGNTLRTWSFVTSQTLQRVQVVLKTDGRPLNAVVDLWQGPDNTPEKMNVYIEDAAERPFCAVLETPGTQNSVSVRNTAQLEFPLTAFVQADEGDGKVIGTNNLSEEGMPENIQGGALKTYSFNPTVCSVQIYLVTDGRPLTARLELLQGPNNNKQVVELYTEDGLARPFYAIIETPGVGNVVRVLNTAPLEFPLSCRVEPYVVDAAAKSPDSVVVGGGGLF